MKKQDIRRIYTQKVTELLNQGYTIFPDTMSGCQGEIAHIDLTDGSEILRVLLTRGTRFDREEGGYWGDTICLMVGKAAEDTRICRGWRDSTIWNNRLEPRFEIEWADLSEGGKEWYTDLGEGRRVMELRRERYIRNRADRREKLGDAFKSTALRWLRKQPKMKTYKPEDIEKMERVWSEDGKRRIEITAKGKRHTIR